jgi:hypothetical protein
MTIQTYRTLTIRLTSEEYDLANLAAKNAYMPLATFARKLLMQSPEAEQLRSETRTQQAMAAKIEPPKPKRPVPMMVYKGETVIDGNTWRDEVLARSERGESVKDIAESYASALSTPEYIKGLIKRGKEEREAHAAWNDATKVYTAMHAQPPAQSPAQPTYPEELVYDPVDPDNPTEEEQAINAEIARRRMVAIGLMSEDERP